MTEQGTNQHIEDYLQSLPESGDEGKLRGYAQMVLDQRAGKRKSLAPPKQFGLTAADAKAIRERLDFEQAREVEVDIPQVVLDNYRGRPERYSLTAVQWAENCVLGMRFAREYDNTGQPAILGSLVHGVVDLLVMELYGRGQAQFEDPLEARELGEKMLETEMHKNVKPMAWSTYQRALDHVETWARIDRIEPDAMILTEHLMVHELAGQPQSARLDRFELVDDLVRIRDYKTGGKLVSQADFEGRVQTPVYGWHVLQDFPHVQWLDLGEVYTEYGIVRQVTIHRNDLDHIEGYLTAATKLIDAAYEQEPDEWTPTPGPHCGNCANSLGCPKKGLDSYVPMHNEANARDLLKWVVVTEAQVATAKKMVQQEVVRLGRPVSILGKAAGFKAKHRHGFDKEAAQAFIEQHGGNLEDYAVDTDHTEFAIYNVGEEEEGGEES